MPIKYKKPNQKYTKDKSISQEALAKRLTITVGAIFGLLIVGIVGFSFFGPQIGALFGFISVNKNDQGPTVKVSLSAPVFYELPSHVKDKEIKIEGFTTPQTKVKLYVNGPEQAETYSNEEGIFNFENVSLNNGRNTLFAKSFSNDNNSESEKSETQVIIYDEKKPRITILEPEDNQTIKNLNERVRIVGEINEEVEIRINDRLVVQKPDNSFDFLLGVKEGEVLVKVSATDKAGNEEIEEFKIYYKKEAS